MSTQTGHERRLFTVEEYDRMAAAGVFSKDDRVELIDGEVVEMTPIGHRHTACVSALTELLVTAVGRGARVWTQGAIELSPRSKPQPDVALLRRRSYADAGPTVADVLLIVEVADTSPAYDRTVKVRRYAEAGVPEVWIVDIGGEAVEVHRTPDGAVYRDVRRAPRDGTVTPLSFPDAVLGVADLFA